jgi:RHS repeat-associated protein
LRFSWLSSPRAPHQEVGSWRSPPHLKTAAVAGTTTTYAYDGDGVRLQASTGPSASEQTHFLWDVNHGLPQLALERDGAGALLRRYTYGVQRLTMVSGSTTSYYHHDGLGSVAAITGGAGATRWTYSYEPFGSIRTEQQGSGTQPANYLKYTGQYLDPTGLYHLRARQYDPTWSRFLSPDPVDASVGSSFVSAYAYSACRPTVLVDPSGLSFRPSSDAEEAAGIASSAAQQRKVTLNLIKENSPLPFRVPCLPTMNFFLDRTMPGAQLQIIANIVDKWRSLNRVSGTVMLRRTTDERVDRHSFSVSNSKVDIAQKRWAELGINDIVQIKVLGRQWEEPEKAIDPYDRDTFGRVQVVQRHTVEYKYVQCTYAGSVKARR